MIKKLTRKILAYALCVTMISGLTLHVGATELSDSKVIEEVQVTVSGSDAGTLEPTASPVPTATPVVVIEEQEVPLSASAPMMMAAAPAAATYAASAASEENYEITYKCGNTVLDGPTIQDWLDGASSKDVSTETAPTFEGYYFSNAEWTYSDHYWLFVVWVPYEKTVELESLGYLDGKYYANGNEIDLENDTIVFNYETTTSVATPTPSPEVTPTPTPEVSVTPSPDPIETPSPTELLEKLDISKEVNVLSWEERTYTIDLTASSTLETTASSTAASDIVILVDRSTSMATNIGASGNNGNSNGNKPNKGNGNSSNQNSSSSQTRMAALNAAATAFIEELAEVAPNSNVGIASFGYEARTLKTLLNVSEYEDELTGVFDNLSWYNKQGTVYSDGLELAGSMLANSTNPKFVVMITDGEPYDSRDYDGISDNMQDPGGITIYGIGIDLDDSSTTQFAKAVHNNSADYIYSADSVESLSQAFSAIAGEVTSKQAIGGVTVTDYIDPRFEVVASDEYEIKTDENGNQYVEWTNQTVNPADGETPGWQKQIVVKAKESYFGGNDITTNIADKSGVTIEGAEKMEKFYADDTTPKVNVKLKESVNVEKTATIFLGESLENHLDSITEQLLADMFGDYDYSGVEIEFGSWYKGEEEITPAEEFPSDLVNTTVYTTDFTIKVKEDGAKAAINMQFPEGTTPEGFDSDDSYYYAMDEENVIGATYTVTVVAGHIEVTKKIDNFDEIIWSQGNPIFIMNLSDETGTTWSKPVEFVENGDDSVTVSFDNLPKGIYSVDEECAIRYAQLGETELSGRNDGSKLYIGYNEALNATDTSEAARSGAATITNQRNYTKNFSDTDLIINTVTIENGKLVIKQEKATKAE